MGLLLLAKGKERRAESMEPGAMVVGCLMDIGFLWICVAQSTKPFRISRLSRQG